jgi:lipopolysaccharide/colanic/teichoic acid biosynthesis glycosyltransferase
MILKYIFDKVVSLIGLICLSPVSSYCRSTYQDENARWACTLQAETGRTIWQVVYGV